MENLRTLLPFVVLSLIVVAVPGAEACCHTNDGFITTPMDACPAAPLPADAGAIVTPQAVVAFGTTVTDWSFVAYDLAAEIVQDVLVCRYLDGALVASDEGTGYMELSDVTTDHAEIWVRPPAAPVLTDLSGEVYVDFRT
ncbi:MAG: hypothetical protein KY455_06725 [Euryarchaeota archaeon]|nr:hypothetical protein [Euryarchaeota archaeon]